MAPTRKPDEAEVKEVLGRLASEGLGVEASNLYDLLGVELRNLWFIFPADRRSLALVRQKADCHLDYHIERLTFSERKPPQPRKSALRGAFNMKEVPERAKNMLFTERMSSLNREPGDLKVMASYATLDRMRGEDVFECLARSVIEQPLTYEQLTARMRERFGEILPPLDISENEHLDSRSPEPTQVGSHPQSTTDQEEDLQSLLDPDERRKPRKLSRRAVVVSILSAMVMTIATTVAAYELLSSSDGGNESPERGPVAQPADPSSLPVRVVSVSEITPAPAGSFALAEKLDMSDEELADFNSKVYPNSDAYSSWLNERNPIPVDSRLFHPKATITLSGNGREEVRITDMKVVKKCGRPVTGTLFSPFDQGTPSTVGIAFNLDEPDPVPQATSQSHPRGAGRSFFSSKSITLKAAEEETLSVGFYSEQYFCEFTLRLFVTTAKGTVYQDLDASGKNRDQKSSTTPFALTALPTEADPEAAHLDYEAAYAIRDWYDEEGQTEQEQYRREWVRYDFDTGEFVIPD